MNYLKVYCNFIRKAENRTSPEGYTEKHHTFPKSIFGKNNRTVVLTAREHYIAHVLLEKIYIKRYGMSDVKTHKMINAHIMMKSGKYINSHLYENVRKRFSAIISKKMLGHKVSEETRKKISFYSKNRSEETLEKIGKSSKGRTLSEETRKKISIANKGKKKPKGHGEKVSIAKKGKPSSLRGRIMPKDHREKIGKSNEKTFYFINPEGQLIEIKNLMKYCEDNNLTRGCFYQLLRGERLEYRGWRMAK